MSETILSINDQFNVHFVWQLPNEDYLRGVFEAKIVDLDWELDRYVVRLERLVAGRQEAPDGTPLPQEKLSLLFWQYMKNIVGNRVHLAFEASDGRPLLLRLPTLTGEHNFFYRLDSENRPVLPTPPEDPAEPTNPNQSIDE